jgi:flagellar hook protein FlgE
MLGSLSSAVSGLDSFQTDMNVIGNNIANVNTDGFKAGTVDFADSFSNTLQAASGATTSTGSSNAIQVGTGVNIDAINANWSTGTLASSNPSDLAINGAGFFVVADPTSKTQYATQVGDFTLDSNGYLVTPDGYRVQGYMGALGTSTTLTDIQIGNNSSTSYSVNGSGVVSMSVDGVSQVVGQIMLQNFQDPNALQNVGGNLFSNMTNAGPLAAVTAPGSNGLGSIKQGYAELSNVDLSGEMANLITAQRGFEANSKVVTASDEMLQTVVNMVH